MLILFWVGTYKMPELIKYLLVILCYNIVSGQTVDHRDQEIEMELANVLKQKELSFINVLDTMIVPEYNTFIGSKQMQNVANIQYSIDNSATDLNELGINQTVFQQIIQDNNDALINAYSTNLELTDEIELISLSINTLSNDIASIVNLSIGKGIYFGKYLQLDQFRTTLNKHMERRYFLGNKHLILHKTRHSI